MPVSAFTQVKPDIIDTYQPIDFNSLIALQESKIQQEDKAELSLNTFLDAQYGRASNLLQGKDTDDYQLKLDEMQSKVNNLTTQYQGNLRSPKFKRELQNLIIDSGYDPATRTAQRAYKEKIVPAIEELKKAKVSNMPWNYYEREENIKTGATEGAEKVEISNITPFVDYTKEALAATNELVANVIEDVNTIAAKDITVKIEDIAPERIANIFGVNLDSVGNVSTSPEDIANLEINDSYFSGLGGQNLRNHARYLKDTQYPDLKIEEIEKNLYSQIVQQVLDTKIYERRTDKNVANVGVLNYSLKKRQLQEQQEKDLLDAELLEATDVGVPESVVELNTQMDDAKQGTVAKSIIGASNWLNKIVGEEEPALQNFFNKVTDSVSNWNTEDAKAFDTTMEKYKKNIIGLKDLEDKGYNNAEIAEIYTGAVNNLTKGTQLLGWSISDEKVRTNLGKQLSNTFSGKTFILQDEEGSFEGEEDVFDELGLGAKDIKGHLRSNGIAGISNSQKYPSMAYFEVEDSGGDPRVVYMTSNLPYEALGKLGNDVMKAALNGNPENEAFKSMIVGKDGKLKKGPNGETLVGRPTSRLIVNDNIKNKATSDLSGATMESIVMIGYKDKSGKFVPTGEKIPLETFVEAYANNLNKRLNIKYKN